MSLIISRRDYTEVHCEDAVVSNGVVTAYTYRDNGQHFVKEMVAKFPLKEITSLDWDSHSALLSSPTEPESWISRLLGYLRLR